MGFTNWMVSSFVLVVVSAIDYKNDPIVKRFQEYIQINSTTNSDLTPVVELWRRLAQEENLPFHVYENVKGYPVIVIKWAGSNSSLSSVMLNSHADVVPAYEQDGWTFPPFSAHITDAGDIYGRGTQDCKCLAIQHFEAMRRLKAQNVQLLRDVYITLMPDEEVGGKSGVRLFRKTKEFALMNVGVELDESRPSVDPSIINVIVRDKAIWQFKVDCTGTSAHGNSMLPVNSTAVGKCLNVMNALYEFREAQYNIAQSSAPNNAGAYTSVNMNIISGGSALNVVPGLVTLIFDVRLGSTVDENKFHSQLNQWIVDAGDGVTLTFIEKDHQTPGTLANDTNPYWKALTAAASKMNLGLNPVVTPGATDGRHLRGHGIPSFGISPNWNTPRRAHGVNEYLNAGVLLRGIDVFEKLIEGLANIPADQVSADPNVYLSY